MITLRDQSILHDIEGLRYMTIQAAISAGYFDNAHKSAYYMAARRFRVMAKAKELKRFRSGICNEWIYCLPRTPECKQVDHLMASLGLWAALKRTDMVGTGRLESFECERVFTYKVHDKEGSFRPDAYFVFNGIPYFFEYHRRRPADFNNKVSNIEEWIKCGGYQELGIVPRILVETDKPDAVMECINKAVTIKEVHWHVTTESALYILGGPGAVCGSSQDDDRNSNIPTHADDNPIPNMAVSRVRSW